MSGRTESLHTGKSQQNRESPSWMHSCVLGQRLVLNIWLASSLNTAMLDITGIEGLPSRNRPKLKHNIVSKIQRWRNKWTRFLKFSRELTEIVLRTLEMAPNRMFQQLTDKTKNKKKQEIFKNFQATTVTNRFNPPLPPSLDSTYKHPWRKSWLWKVRKTP